MFQDYPSSQKMKHKYNCYTDGKSNRQYVLRLSFVYKYFILTLEKIVGELMWEEHDTHGEKWGRNREAMREEIILPF